MKVKGIVRLVVLLSSMLTAEWIYTVRSPIVGELGTIRLDKRVEGKRYVIKGSAVTAGLVKTLSGHRRERYLSEGSVAGGRYRSEHFRIERKSDKKREIVDYRIDDKSRKITKHKVRWKRGKLDRNSTETLKYFTDDDLATLYFNLLPPAFDPGKSRSALAAGAEKIDGWVTVYVPDPAQADKERKHLGVGNGSTIVYLLSKKELLGKKNRKIVAAFDAEGILSKAYLVAIPIVGEIYIERVKRKP